MAGPALLHAYRYAYPSTVERGAKGSHLSLATSSVGDTPHPFFFEGTFVAPRRAADAMLTVARVARTRFFVPPSMLAKILAAADPVVTCTRERVRFEAFSACAGVYARFDLHGEGVRADHVNAGTTNVDFNAGMRTLLARVGAKEDVRLFVGKDQVKVARAKTQAIEHKVPLPVRWLRSFGEVQAILARMTPALRVSGLEARRFLRALPKQPARGVSWVVRSGQGLRITQVATRDAVAIGGLDRLAVLADAAGDASELVGYGASGGSSAWELVFPEGRFVLALSPEVWRGFSGEGGLLRDLASDAGAEKKGLSALRAELRWQASLDPRALAKRVGLAEDDVKSGLATLASRGLVGFELGSGTYFHRELPFQLDALAGMHPRLEDARQLVENEAISNLVERDGVARARVAASGDGAYDVEARPDDFRCTCPWYGKHGTTRGPCKHVLAVQLACGGTEEEDADGDKKTKKRKR
jgi:hypothetical protein